MKIGFHSNQLSLTGTEIALFDYAHHNEQVLGHKSVIFYQIEHPNNHPEAIQKFANRFELVAYSTRQELDDGIHRHGCSLLYAIKSGKRDGLISQQVPTMVHAVFPTSPRHIHGASYAYISPWLSQHCSRGKIPSVSHIVDMPNVTGNLRDELNIPQNALVLGSYGGRKSFDVPCALSAVNKLLSENEQIVFLFMNFDRFVDHPRALFLAPSSDMNRKAQFINTCNAMLHARLQGESFGLAVGEFSVLNKPVLAYRYAKHTHHLNMLGNRGLIYEDETSLIDWVNKLPHIVKSSHSWDCYSQTCNPQTVMTDFDQHLIQPALANSNWTRPQIDIGLAEEFAYWKFKWQMARNTV